MSTLTAHGLLVDLPLGWEAAIYRRPQTSAGSTHPVMHIGSFALPVDRGDFGSGAVDLMGADDALIVLLEYHSSSVGNALFARQGLPRTLRSELFSPLTLQRGIPGQAGTQLFFTEAGRAFCLYVVLGSYGRRTSLVAAVNDVLWGIRIDGSPG